jgi:hypothetical protein
VPEVDAVGADTDPPEHREAEEPRHEPRRGVHGRRDQHRGDDRDDEEPAAVEVRVELADVQEHPEQRDASDDRDPVEQDARVPSRLADEAPRCPHERERGPQQQRGDARVGAVVDARRIGVGVVEDRHLERRDRDADEHAHEQRAAALAPHAEHEHEDERPQQVELLLHRQRPHVLEQRWPARALEVGEVAEDEEPVLDVGQRGDHLAP